ncbi:MCE family protein [Luteolibacter yonseiensis]|uniref:MCE family protein n=1 Tax=Luteolibacter yonseiensis TaxID=1144680 RepID=A0A934R4F5_9BACT|nr:MlaD family protein [Luteolibacter yonseiensis]MBK1815848.1 MCE family protein [Luteolibacter yonseiensis]
MSDTDTSPPAAATPDLRAARRWNIVWVVPVIALLVGAWMIWRNLSSQGPVAYLRFETAEGIDRGKTEVRCRSVRVGVVKDVQLAEDSVVVSVELDPDYGNLLRSGTNFWVVRPRVTASAITGIGTLITGAYIELNPGPDLGDEVNHFTGLETPPATSSDIPGRRIMLTADQAGSLIAGSPIYYRGFEVGRIENRKLDFANERVTFDAFIREEYSSLVKENTRFWNASGVDFDLGADGVKVRTSSLQAIVSGGAAFGTPEGEEPGKTVDDGTIFPLFPDQDSAQGAAFNPTLKFLLLFDQTVRGLKESAPVEFKGIPIGRVVDISFDYLQDNKESRIPVLVEIDPSFLRREAAENIGKEDHQFLANAVKDGLRATLKSGNLLTGALFVDVNYMKDAKPAELAKIGEYLSVPTVSGGLENQLTAALEKFKNLDVEGLLAKLGTTAENASAMAAEIKEAAASVRTMTDSADFAKIPADLRANLAAFEKLSATLDKSVTSYGPDGPLQGDMLRTLEEVRALSRSMKSLMNSIDEKPNSLLFGRDSSGNPVPKAPKANR